MRNLSSLGNQASHPLSLVDASCMNSLAINYAHAEYRWMQHQKRIRLQQINEMIGVLSSWLWYCIFRFCVQLPWRDTWHIKLSLEMHDIAFSALEQMLDFNIGIQHILHLLWCDLNFVSWSTIKL